MSMNYDEFIDGIANHPHLAWNIPDCEEGKTLYVKNTVFDVEMKIDLKLKPWEKFPTFSDFVAFSKGGKDVAKITRVTGFFSFVDSWNKGKQGELKDRHRENMPN